MLREKRLLSSLPHRVHRCGPGNKGSELSSTLNFIYTLVYAAVMAFMYVVCLGVTSKYVASRREP